MPITRIYIYYIINHCAGKSKRQIYYIRKKAAIAHIVPCKSFAAAVLLRENPALDAKDAP